MVFKTDLADLRLNLFYRIDSGGKEILVENLFPFFFIALIS